MKSMERTLPMKRTILLLLLALHQISDACEEDIVERSVFVAEMKEQFNEISKCRSVHVLLNRYYAQENKTISSIMLHLYESSEKSIGYLQPQIEDVDDGFGLVSFCFPDHIIDHSMLVINSTLKTKISLNADGGISRGMSLCTDTEFLNIKKALSSYNGKNNVKK